METEPDSRLLITPKARAHLARLPSAPVLRGLSQQVSGLTKTTVDTGDVISLVNTMLCHIDVQARKAVPYRTFSHAGIANPKDVWLFRARQGWISEGLSGCWAPPIPLAVANRINRAGEPMLYTSRAPHWPPMRSA